MKMNKWHHRITFATNIQRRFERKLLFETFSKIDHHNFAQITKEMLFTRNIIQIHNFTQYNKQVHEVHINQTNQFFDEKTRLIVTHAFRNQKSNIYWTCIALHDETYTFDMKQKKNNRDHVFWRNENIR